MPKILSRDGQSLADIYDVEGSIAGIDQLETSELPIVHEMGNTVLSERFTTRVFRIPSGNVLQNADFNVELTTLPETPARLLGVQVIHNNLTLRVARAAVLLTDPTVNQDFPIWLWDSAAGLSETVEMDDAGTGADFALLVPAAGINGFATFAGGVEQQGNMVSNVKLTGRTTGFGAGTAETIALLLLAFPRRDINISSKGLPIPSW